MVKLHIILKGITKYSNVAANILPLDPHFFHDPRGWGQKVKIELFQNMVMLHNKLKGILKCSNMVANILKAKSNSKLLLYIPFLGNG